jgi:hypothetical protein
MPPGIRSSVLPSTYRAYASCLYPAVSLSVLSPFVRVSDRASCLPSTGHNAATTDSSSRLGCAVAEELLPRLGEVDGADAMPLSICWVCWHPRRVLAALIQSGVGSYFIYRPCNLFDRNRFYGRIILPAGVAINHSDKDHVQLVCVSFVNCKRLIRPSSTAMDVHEPKQLRYFDGTVQHVYSSFRIARNQAVQPVYSSFWIARNQAGHPILDV